MATKHDKLRAIVEQETAWSGGTDHPWEGDALLSPKFLERLTFLASHAPGELLEDLSSHYPAS